MNEPEFILVHDKHGHPRTVRTSLIQEVEVAGDGGTLIRMVDKYRLVTESVEEVFAMLTGTRGSTSTTLDEERERFKSYVLTQPDGAELLDQDKTGKFVNEETQHEWAMWMSALLYIPRSMG